MARGKFEAGFRNVPEGEQPRRRFSWLFILIPLLVIGALTTILVFTLGDRIPSRNEEERGFTKKEILEQYRNLSLTIENSNMELTLIPSDPDAQDEPIVLTVPPSVSRIRVDLNGLNADLDDGVGKIGFNRYRIDTKKYLSFDRSALMLLAEQTEERYASPFLESFATVERVLAGVSEYHVLELNTGNRGIEIKADEIYEALLDAYVEGNLHAVLTYETIEPKPLNAEEIRNTYTTDPVDAVLDMTTFEITPEIPGYGLELTEIQDILDNAEPGKGYQLTLRTLPAKETAESLEASLYCDILGEAHTPHSWINDRTHNLILACDEINGTIVMPGEVFSFNETVGQRTEAKGYREATAYVGGASVPEIGGGVCQVASSIYYAVLQADLRTVERRSHTYLVTYVPQGMDAAIYWGSLDYKFENTSPTPIKIEASVSDGKVHIILWGREWKDYTVDLHYQILEEIPWETKTQTVYDGSHKNGDVLVTPYTGYKISTSKTLKDLDGNVIETVHIATSSYRKRDKVVAVVYVPPAPTEPSTSSPDD